jgi:DNA polymerase I-like protein with 3'-5' exonuclease and polymerase domains
VARFDAIGMFWEDMPTSRKRGNIVRPMPPIPETGWKAPTDFPNLRAAVVKSIDTETYDPELEQSGPGWARHCGHIVGFSIGAKDSLGNVGQWYVPLAHTICPEENVKNPEQWIAWLKDQCADDVPKVGANLIYDLGWLAETGVTVNGPLYDIQHAEALLDERARVALEVLAQKYLGEGKASNILYEWCASYYGGNPTEKQRKNIWRSPPSLVGPYGEADAALPLRIIEKQWPLLDQEGLMDVFQMECELMPLMLAMRFAGAPVDIPYAEQLYDEFGKDVKVLEENLYSLVGFHVNVNSANDLAKAFDKAGIPYSKTKSKNPKPSFTADFLDEVDHPVGKVVVGIRQKEKLRGTFLKSYLLENHVNGLVYGSFNQLRGEKGGTRSGRFSSDTPNLQNIPTRTTDGKKIRRAFADTVYRRQWLCYDYSQIEYRFLAHFAVDKGDGSADALRASYIDTPDIDYHRYVHDLIHGKTGVDLIRGHVKNMNFGLIYGMGEPKLARTLGITSIKGKELFQAYHGGAPYVKATMDATMAEAQAYGVITTVMGRKSRFDLWEPDSWEVKGIALPYDMAVVMYGRVRRAYGHKALNRRLQGSAADMMKKAMWYCWKDGIFDETGVPRLTVHDELDFLDPGGKDKAFYEMQRVLETCMPELRIPIKVERKAGPNWGDAEKVK